MSYNAKNYTDQGGERTVIGGILEFTDEARVVNLPDGSVGKAVAVADSTATTVAGLKDNFNALLASLRDAGLMEV